MRINRKFAYRRALAVLIAIAFAIQGIAAINPAKFSSIRVGNFGVVSDNYFRGAQPKGQDYQDIAALGIQTVIDLTHDGEAKANEQEMVESAGMRFYRIPMTTSDRPSDGAIAQFLELVNNPENQPVFVHCQGGRHRTGVMTAVYRMTKDGWTAEQAYGEMKQYKFEGFLGHPTLKHFVYDYYGKLDHSQTPNAQNTAGMPATAIGTNK